MFISENQQHQWMPAKMIRYLLKRLFSGVVLLFIYISILFFAIQIFLPGDYVSQFTLGLSPSDAQDLRETLGLDLPIWQRYLNWLIGILHGDLGNSFSPFEAGDPVMDVIKSTLPITLLIFGSGTALAFIIGQWLGKVAAWRGPGAVSSSITVVSIALYTSFPPWLAFLVIHFLAFRLGIPLHLGGRPMLEAPGVTEAIVVTQMLFSLVGVVILLLALNAFLHRTRRGLPAVIWALLLAVGWFASWKLLGIEDDAIEILRMAVVPILLYTALAFGEVMLIMRTSMVDTLHEDYVQTARAKGLPERKVRDRHAARNALLPVVSRLVISLPFLFSGMVMIEDVLNVDGLGSALFYGVGMQNITLAMGIMLVIGAISLGARLVLDIVQVALDPRIRTGGA